MRHRRRAATVLYGLVLTSAYACGRGEAPSAASGAAEAGSSATPGPASLPEPSGEARDAAGQQPAAAGSIVEAAGLRFVLPPSFESEPPASPMRLAQAVIAGDAGPAELALFHFGAGQGGSVEANFERWTSQVERAPGSPGPQRGSFSAGELEVEWIEAAGTMLPSGMGPGPKTPQPGYRLLGAVVEGDGGPWFFKVTGPDATVAAAREPFLAMLRGVRYAG